MLLFIFLLHISLFSVCKYGCHDRKTLKEPQIHRLCSYLWSRGSNAAYAERVNVGSAASLSSFFPPIDYYFCIMFCFPAVGQHHDLHVRHHRGSHVLLHGWQEASEGLSGGEAVAGGEAEPGGAEPAAGQRSSATFLGLAPTQMKSAPFSAHKRSITHWCTVDWCEAGSQSVICSPSLQNGRVL